MSEPSAQVSFITAEEIEGGIAAEHRNLFTITSAPLPRGMFRIVEAFWVAYAAIAPATGFMHRVHIIFATAPFSLNLANGELRYTPHNPETIGTHVHGLVFLDCNNLLPLAYEHQVACILEELVHAFMHIRDENLVSVVVASLYSGVQWIGGKYVIVGASG